MVSKGVAALRADLRLSGAGDTPVFGGRGTLVYTAFDGDDFYFTDAMSVHALDLGNIPLSPESCLGYKSAVDVLMTKRRVLHMDISLLKNADEIWIYRFGHFEADWGRLAEGVIVEVLCYLRRSIELGRPPRVATVALDQVLEGKPAAPEFVVGSARAIFAQIASAHPDIVEVAEGILADGLADSAVALYPIADAKNAAWIREWVIRHGWAPMVPTLAFPVTVVNGVERLVAAWCAAVAVADVVIAFPPSTGRSSLFLDFLVDLATRRRSTKVVGDWFEVRAPKAVHGESWPISAKERQDVRDYEAQNAGSEMEKGLA